MNILYKPVFISSADQANALPFGTQRLQDGRQGLAVGYTALVPIVAKEETRAPHPDMEYQRRLVTPWEDA